MVKSWRAEVHTQTTEGAESRDKTTTDLILRLSRYGEMFNIQLAIGFSSSYFSFNHTSLFDLVREMHRYNF